MAIGHWPRVNFPTFFGHFLTFFGLFRGCPWDVLELFLDKQNTSRTLPGASRTTFSTFSESVPRASPIIFPGFSGVFKTLVKIRTRKKIWTLRWYFFLYGPLGAPWAPRGPMGSAAWTEPFSMNKSRVQSSYRHKIMALRSQAPGT